MKMFDEIKAEILTRIVLVVGRVMSKASDDTMLGLLNIARRFMTEPEAQEAVDEVIDAVKLGPPNTDLIRKLLAESEYVEMRDFIDGVFFFHEMDPEDIC